MKKILISILLIVLGVFIYYGLIDSAGTTVELTSPKQDDTKVLDDQPIIIKFAQSIDAKERQKISAASIPIFSFSSAWKDEKTLILTPSDPLIKDTLYSVVIKYKLKTIYSFTFKTNLYSTKELRSQVREQIEADYDFANVRNQLNIEYPWLKKLPLETPEYAVVYDFDTSKFRIHLKEIPATPNIRNILVNRAIDQLKDIGATVSAEEAVVIFPENNE